MLYRNQLKQVINYRPDEETKENSQYSENNEDFEEVNIEIEPVDDEKDEYDIKEPFKDQDKYSLRGVFDQDSSKLGGKDDSENLIATDDILKTQIEHSKGDTSVVTTPTTKVLEDSKFWLWAIPPPDPHPASRLPSLP